LGSGGAANLDGRSGRVLLRGAVDADDVGGWMLAGGVFAQARAQQIDGTDRKHAGGVAAALHADGAHRRLPARAIDEPHVTDALPSW
jgi:hypothetical protein